KIVDMRRHLVMEESDFPSELTSLFNNIERNANPWEISNDKRAEWATDLGVPLMSENPDADVLYWVGCMGSFDRRNQKVATAVTKVLLAAGVNFAILGPEESCTGDPARRIGNEYLWQMMAQQNIKLPAGFDQRKLTYHDPCYIGRYNDVYDEPRHVLKVLNSNGVTEMKHHRNKSFCCGGGGGRAWMEEKIGKRVNQTRVNEALE